MHEHLSLPPCPSAASVLPLLPFLAFSLARAALLFCPHWFAMSLPQQQDRVLLCAPGWGQQLCVTRVSIANAIFQGLLTKSYTFVWAWNPAFWARSQPAQPHGSVQNLITVTSAIFLVEKLDSGRFQMLFVPHVCATGVATVKEMSSPTLRGSSVIKHRFCWGRREVSKYTLFPKPLSFTQQHGLTFKINLCGKVISVRMLALEYPQ